jgi:hypothetical protein
MQAIREGRWDRLFRCFGKAKAKAIERDGVTQKQEV